MVNSIRQYCQHNKTETSNSYKNEILFDINIAISEAMAYSISKEILPLLRCPQMNRTRLQKQITRRGTQKLKIKIQIRQLQHPESTIQLHHDILCLF